MNRGFPGYRGRGWISNDPAYSPAGLKDDEINIDKIGFVVFMLPEEFLELNPKRKKKRNLKSLAQHVGCGGAIGPARLAVVWSEDRLGWQVVNHEGRGRMIIIHLYDPLSEVPVCVIPRDGAKLDKDLVFSPIYADKRSKSGKTKHPIAFHPVRVRYRGVEKKR